MSSKTIEERAPYKGIQSTSRTTYNFESERFAIRVEVERNHVVPGDTKLPLPDRVVGHAEILLKNSGPSGNEKMYSCALDLFIELAKLVNYARSNAGIPEGK